jgi:hypothetical protein
MAPHGRFILVVALLYECMNHLVSVSPFTISVASREEVNNDVETTQRFLVKWEKISFDGSLVFVDPFFVVQSFDWQI